MVVTLFNIHFLPYFYYNLNVIGNKFKEFYHSEYVLKNCQDCHKDIKYNVGIRH